MLPALPEDSVNCCVTSPPYWGLRDYGVDGQLGLEKTPDEYVSRMVAVFREVRRVLRGDGTLWLNLGDSYASDTKSGNRNDTKKMYGAESQQLAKHSKIVTETGLKPKDLVGIPWRVAFALQADGWYLRQDIIWHKPNPMPESVTDRCTKAHEYIFLMSKSARYYYDNDAIKENATDCKPRPAKPASKYAGHEKDFALHSGFMRGTDAYFERNRRSVWTVATHPYPDAHFATFPESLIEPCIRAGCPEGGTVIDPFMGAGTTGLVSKKLGRHYIGVELNAEYREMAMKRIEKYTDGNLLQYIEE